jgi:hypothetical protein
MFIRSNTRRSACPGSISHFGASSSRTCRLIRAPGRHLLVRTASAASGSFMCIKARTPAAVENPTRGGALLPARATRTLPAPTRPPSGIPAPPPNHRPADDRGDQRRGPPARRLSAARLSRYCGYHQRVRMAWGGVHRRPMSGASCDGRPTNRPDVYVTATGCLKLSVSGALYAGHASSSRATSRSARPARPGPRPMRELERPPDGCPLAEGRCVSPATARRCIRRALCCLL